MYIDTHLDTLYQSIRSDRKFAEKEKGGHVDLHRAREAGLFIGFFTGFPTENRYATQKMVREWIHFVNNPANQFELIKSVEDLNNFYDEWKPEEDILRDIGMVLHFEGAAGIDSELNLLHIYYELGLRSMSLTWNEQNQFATGVKGAKDRGLTQEGKDLIATMEDLGIIIDVSHLNDNSFWDVIDAANNPVIASHSNLRDPADHPRNLTDDMVQAIIDTGGTIGINFCKGFLSHNQEQHPANRGCAKWMIRKIIELGSAKNVHIGSDFDGCTVPDDVGDITIMPTLFQELKDEFSLENTEIDNIKHGNIMRMIREYWK